MKQLTKINSKNLTLGMRFSAPVFFDDGENMFLAERKPVREYHLEALRRWKLDYVVTYGSIILTEDQCDDVEDVEALEEIEELEELDELDDLEEVEELSGDSADDMNGMDAQYDAQLAILSTFFRSYMNGDPLDRGMIDTVAEEVLRLLNMDSQAATTFLMNKTRRDGYPSRALDSAYFAGAVALRLSLPFRKIQQIIHAALLHDLSMLMVPESIRQKKSALSVDEFELLKMHTIKGGRYLNDVLLYPRDVTLMVVQHHEKWNGKGYPEGRRGQDIDIGSRIISVVDAFNAMISEKPYRNAITGYETVKQILAEAGQSFDPSVVKAFVMIMGVYPAGSFVQLNDGAIAKVLESESDSLFLPTVQILRTGSAATAKLAYGTQIRLKDQKELFVARAVDPSEISGV